MSVLNLTFDKVVLECIYTLLIHLIYMCKSMCLVSIVSSMRLYMYVCVLVIMSLIQWINLPGDLWGSYTVLSDHSCVNSGILPGLQYRCDHLNCLMALLKSLEDLEKSVFAKRISKMRDECCKGIYCVTSFALQA